MLRSLKNSLKSGKSKASSSSPKEESQAVVSKQQQQVSSSSVKQPTAPAAKQQGQSVKEKPPLPVISEHNLQLCYAEQLPSFRECHHAWRHRQHASGQARGTLQHDLCTSFSKSQLGGCSARGGLLQQPSCHHILHHVHLVFPTCTCRPGSPAMRHCRATAAGSATLLWACCWGGD